MTDPIDQKARECAEKCAYHGQYGCDVSIFTPIIAAAIREATEDLTNALDIANRSADEQMRYKREAEAERDALRGEYESRALWIAKMLQILDCENKDGFHCRDPHAVAQELMAERDQRRAEGEHIKAWANAKVEELDHYKRVFKSNGRSMELMAARIAAGHDVIDAVIEASAVSADSPGVLVWPANAPEQIEAALARIAALKDNSAKQ